MLLPNRKEAYVPREKLTGYFSRQEQGAVLPGSRVQRADG